MGQLTGNGVINSNNSIDFKMLLKLAGGGGLLGQFTNLSAAAQNKGIPFVIQGTTSNPSFLFGARDLGNTFKALSTGQQEQNPAQGLGGLFGNILNKKKKPQ